MLRTIDSKVVLLKIFLLFFGMFVCVSSLFGQYGPFYPDERDIRSHSQYHTYVDIIKEYNKGKAPAGVIQKLDSLAVLSLKASDDLQFLFLRNEISNLYRHQSKFTEAYDMLKSSMQTFRSANDTNHIEYFSSLRLMRTTLNDIRKLPGKSDFEGRPFNELFQAQFAILEALNETGEPLRNTLVDYGLMLFNEGRKEEAIQALYRARNLALEADDLASLAVADYSIISNMPSSHDLLKTKNEVLKTDIELFEAKPNSIPVLLYSAYFNTNVSENYFENFEDTDRAIVYAEKSTALLDTLKYPAHNIKAATHGNLARYYADKNDTLRLWSNVKKVRDIAGTQSMSAYNRTLAYSLICEAVLPYAPDSAFSYLSVIDTLSGRKFFLHEITELKIRAHLQKGKLSEAQALIFSAFDNFEEAGGHKVPEISNGIDYINQISLLEILEKIYLQLEADNQTDYTPAIVKLITRQISLFKSMITEDIYGFETSGFAGMYDKFLERALPYMFEQDKEKYFDETKDLVLASKAIHLNNLMAKNKFQSKLENDTTLFSRLLKSSKEVQESRNKLAFHKQVDGDTKYNLQMELNSKLTENLMFRYEIDEKYKSQDMKIFKDIAALASLSDIQSQLDEHEAIIEYFVFNDSWGQVLILSDTTMSFYHEDENLAKKTKKERYAIMTGRKTTDLGEALFGDVSPYLKEINKLVIIPDDELNFIPFEWLNVNKRMLIEDFAVSYSYSAVLWHNLKKAHKFRAPESLLSIAPLFDENINLNNTQYASNYRGISKPEALPYSLEEITGIEAIMRNQLQNIKHLEGKNATLSNVKSQIPGYDIIHFATHSLVNKDHPERSGLYLFLDDKNAYDTGNNIGLFSLGVLFNMQINAELMVLSACNTGYGEHLEGEGVIALPRGCILSGVPRVLASLWKVHDERTKDMMHFFYKHLAEGNTYSEALRLAKLDAIKEGFLAKNWAGFILIGD